MAVLGRWMVDLLENSTNPRPLMESSRPVDQSQCPLKVLSKNFPNAVIYIAKFCY